MPSFDDSNCHATINVDELDPECDLPGLVINQPCEIERPTYILNNSFGMLGINPPIACSITKQASRSCMWASPMDANQIGALSTTQVRALTATQIGALEQTSVKVQMITWVPPQAS